MDEREWWVIAIGKTGKDRVAWNIGLVIVELENVSHILHASLETCFVCDGIFNGDFIQLTMTQPAVWRHWTMHMNPVWLCDCCVVNNSACSQENYNHAIFECFTSRGCVEPGRTAAIEFKFSPLEAKTYMVAITALDGCKVFWWVDLFICLSLCLSIHISQKLHCWRAVLGGSGPSYCSPQT